MSYRKLFLVFVLVFAALTLGHSQEARADCAEDDWICLIFGGPVNGSYGSTVLVYTCTKGQGVSTNTLTLGDPDTFVSSAHLVCDFKGTVPGKGIICTSTLTYTGELASCNDNNGAGPAVLTVQSKCNDLNVSGTFHCDSQPDNLGGTFPEVTDNLGVNSGSECKKLYKDEITLFTQATFNNTCPVVLTSTTSAGLVLKDVTKTTINICHGDADPITLVAKPPDCVVQPGGTTNKAGSTIPNLAQTACIASPSTWNVDCTGGSGTKDQGSGRVCFVKGAAGFPSFDATNLAFGTATLNGVPVALSNKKQPQCEIKDCDGDQVADDVECTFPTCFNGIAPAEGGELTMIMNFKSSPNGEVNGLTCTTHVNTSGQGS